MTDSALVLLGHGSRDQTGAEEFLAVAAAVRASWPDLPVEAGVLEFAGPVARSIPEAFERAVAAGARRIVAVPVLLHFGEHGTRDMPGEVAAARARHASVEIRLARPLAGHAGLLDLLAERCAATDASLQAGETVQSDSEPVDTPRDGTTVLLVGRGSTLARANADLYATARLFQERGPFGAVEVCFVSLAPPCVFAGLRRCVALGARRVLVMPYFINTGLLVRRIASQVDAARLFYPAVHMAVGPHFGAAPLLIAALLDRVREAWAELAPAAASEALPADAGTAANGRTAGAAASDRGLSPIRGRR